VRSALLPVLVSAGLLAGCGGDPRADLRGLVEGITLEANDRDADGVRRGVEDLLAHLDDAVASGDLSESEAAALRDQALALQAGADEIDPRVLAQREAEARAAEAQRQLEEERAAARREAERREAEARGKAAEGARKAEEEARKAEEEARKKAEERDDDEDDERASRDERGGG
jgi:hypothetical protein